MAWIVIIDNGEEYSDHTHWTACTCKDKATADKAVAAFNEWRDRALMKREADYDELEEWLRSNPCPLYTRYMFTPFGHTAEAVEIPEWAE